MNRGDRITADLTISRYTPFRGDWGYRHIYAFTDAEGGRYVWFGTTPLHVRASRDECIDITEGTWPVRATVKVFKPDGEVTLSRCEIDLLDPPKASPDEVVLRHRRDALETLADQAAGLSVRLYALSREARSERLLVLAARGHARAARRQGRLRRAGDELARTEGERAFGPGRELLKTRGMLSGK